MSYSWGSDDSTPRDGGAGYSYSSARGAYDPGPSSSGSSKSSSRSYARKSAVEKYPLDKKITTQSPTPLVVAVDVTGSMADWPQLIFEKLPLLYSEVKRYMPEVEISFAAVGDAYSDSYPIQIRDFGKDKDLDAKVNSLYPEGGGGGSGRESYELTALFYNKNCEMPKAKKPIFIFAGDEGFYENLDASTIEKYLGGSEAKNFDGKKIMKELASKYDAYLLHKEYGSSDDYIVSQWKDAIGNERVLKLEDPKRIVDCIIGIVAASSGQFVDFSKRLSKRQTNGQVQSVMTTLHKISSAPSTSAVSKTPVDPSAKKSKKLT